MENFWNTLDNLIRDKEIVIDRSKGSTHPSYPDYIYPYDYGYIKYTTSADGGGIDTWLGSGDIKSCIILGIANAGDWLVYIDKALAEKINGIKTRKEMLNVIKQNEIQNQ